MRPFFSSSAPRRRTGARGFTLIELLVTFVVVAIMMTLAAPSFVSFQKNSQLTSAANTLLGAVTAARAEAMKRQLNAYVSATSGDWTQGWTVYVDTNWDQAYTSGTDTLVSTQAALPGVTVDSDTTAHYVALSGAGFVIDASGVLQPSQGVTLKNDINQRRMVIIDGSGRVRVCDPDKDTGCAVTAPNSY